MPIRSLPQELVNQIAAGEVVERPASVVKELLENSVDAGSQAIEVRIMEGGIKSLRVMDDGIGIPREELSLALAPHATSKLAAVEDLSCVTTLGFRGEALASIAAVSHLTLTSRTAQEPHGWAIEASGHTTKPGAIERGTIVLVEDLYYNIPARRKFLKSAATEAAHCETALIRLALSRPKLAFSFHHNQRQVRHLTPGDLPHRLGQILGQEFLDHGAEVNAEAGPLQLTGMVTLPTYSVGTRDQQYLFINGRFVRDKLLTHALKTAYHDVLHSSRHFGHVLFFTLPPELLDVNVHPAKMEVRFREPQAVHRFFMHAVERVLSHPRTQPVPSSPISLPYHDASAPSPPIVQEAPPSYRTHSTAHTTTRTSPQSIENYLNFVQAAHPAPPASPAPSPAAPTAAQQNIPAFARPPLGYAVGQVHRIFLLAENDEGLVMVDIHAAHERLLYERLKAQKSPQRQNLLVPLVIRATPLEMSTFHQYRELLAQRGLEITEGGRAALVIRAIPALLADADAEPLVHKVLANLAKQGDSREIEQAENHLLSTLACHNAIRAGHTLSVAEMNALLRDIETTLRADQCNHGRPVWVQLTHKELDRFFIRGR